MSKARIFHHSSKQDVVDLSCFLLIFNVIVNLTVHFIIVLYMSKVHFYGKLLKSNKINSWSNNTNTIIMTIN